MSPLVRLWLGGLLTTPALGSEATVVVAPRLSEQVLVSAATQPAAYRYAAFPTLLRTGPDEVWLAYKAGRSHATDVGAAIEVVRHTLSTGQTALIQRLPAPEPKLYQMGELARMPDGTVLLAIDVQEVGWDGRHYRAGAEVFRWDQDRKQFAGPTPLGPVDGVLYGYPLEFVTEGHTAWQLIMAFGYHQPAGRWSVDVLRSDDSGGAWRRVRNLTEEFGGIRANESGFIRHGDGFIVATRGYDGIARLHRTDGDFRVLRQIELSGKHSFINNIIGRPRLFVRDGGGYVLGRNWTRAKGSGTTASAMQLSLIRFDPVTLAVTGCTVLDNADHGNVTDGYYAVSTFTREGATTRFHVFTYKALDRKPPEIVRFDYQWEDVK
jgi:hypothetical protein